MLRLSLFKKREIRRFDYQPVFYDPKKDTGEDSIELKKFDFKAAREEQKAEVSPSFDMYHSGTVDFDKGRIRGSRIVKMGLLMGMALACFIYFYLPRPSFFLVIEEAFQIPPIIYESLLFLLVFVMLIFFIREGNKV